MIDSEMIRYYNSLEKLYSLDKHYYPKENFNKNINRYLNRSFIVDSKSFYLFKCLSKRSFLYNQKELNSLSVLNELFDKIGVIDSVESYRYSHSFYQKNIRLRQRISKILKKDNLLFLTFTFNNDYIDKRDDIKRNYVQRWLKKYCNDYIGNVDFGGENGRIHFHAVVSLKLKDVDCKSWKYGAINFKRIITKNDKSLTLYINKLCSHALKESTKRQHLLYPKKNT